MMTIQSIIIKTPNDYLMIVIQAHKSRKPFFKNNSTLNITEHGCTDCAARHKYS